MIEKPGTLTRLNSLFDDGAANRSGKWRTDTEKSGYDCDHDHQSGLCRLSELQPVSSFPNEPDSAKGSPDRRGNGKKGK